jgi:hypothetical protein
MEFDTGLAAFCKSFSANLVALMSGAPSIPFAGFALYAKNPGARLLFWLLAAFCMILAAYFIWRTERIRASNLKNDLDHERLALTPQLVGSIEQYIICALQIAALRASPTDLKRS